MYIYYNIFAISIVLFWLSQHCKVKNSLLKTNISKRLIWIIACLPPIFLSGLRYGNGRDFYSYEAAFQIIAAGSATRMESGYVWLNRWCNWLGIGFVGVTLITSTIIFILFAKGCFENSEKPLLSIFLMLAANIYFESFNAIRQMIAVAIFFYAVKYIQNGEFKKYFFCVLIASFFHTSAIVLLIVYFARRFKMNGTKSILSATGVLIFGNVLFQLLEIIISYTPYAWYIGTSEFIVAATSGSIVTTTIVMLLMIIYRKSAEKNKKYQFMFNLQFISWIVALLSLVIPFSRRLQMYFSPFCLYTVPMLLSQEKNKIVRYTLTFGIIVMYLAIMYYQMFVSGYNNAVPYKSVFSL